MLRSACGGRKTGTVPGGFETASNWANCSPPRRRRTGWSLNRFGGSARPEEFPLAEPGPVVLGRGSECSIRLDDSQVSRRHCQLTFANGGWSVADLGSRNGTCVNGERVAMAQLADGDVIALGVVRLVIKCAAAPVPKPAAPPAAAPAKAPRILARRFRLEKLIHQGATGQFYRARDAQSDRPVCVKLLARHVAADEAQLRRFVRGVRAAARLRHPNIVALYLAGRSGNDWWLAMEYVDGPSARQLAADVGVGNMLPPRRVYEIACHIAAALEAAFAHQVLHRNIRPDCILLTRQGTAKLGNFTLARGVVRDTLDQITSTSQLVGDLAYLAPELSEPAGFVDCRADLYGLGACLYALLTGRPPFTGTGTVDLLERVRRQPPVPPSRINMAVPGPLEAIVLKCLAKSPTDRYATPRELMAELERAGRYQGLWG